MPTAILINASSGHVSLEMLWCVIPRTIGRVCDLDQRVTGRNAGMDGTRCVGRRLAVNPNLPSPRSKYTLSKPMVGAPCSLRWALLWQPATRDSSDRANESGGHAMEAPSATLPRVSISSCKCAERKLCNARQRSVSVLAHVATKWSTEA